MGYRCEACKLFCAVESEVEGYGLDLDSATGMITGQVSINLNSQCCYDQVAQAEYAVEHYPGGWEPHCTLEGHDVELVEGGYEPDEMWEPEGRPMRYQRHHYGFTVEATISCSCGEEWLSQVKGFVQASDFEKNY